MKVTKLETLRCGAGWRNYNFLKLSTDEGIVGWSEFDEGFGSPGVGTVIEQLAGRVIGRPVSAHEHIHAELYCATRPAAGGVVTEAMGAIENALLDAKAKALGVPCYQLLGGKLRDRIRLYWSHCATWRINHPAFYKPPITDLDGVKAIGREVREKGFGALKTNLFAYQDGKPQGWRPGFGRPFYPELNVDKNVLRNLRMHLEALDRSFARPQFQRQDRGLSQDPPRACRFRHVLDRDRQLQPRGAGLHPPAQPAPDQLLRDAVRIARVPAVFARAGNGRGHHRHGVR